MRTAAALSRTEEPGVAAAEAADAAAVALARSAGSDTAVCDLAVVFVTPDHASDLGSVAAAVEARLEPGVLVGAVADGVIGPGEEVEVGPAVSIFVAHLGGGFAQPFRAWTLRPSGGKLAVAGWPDTAPGDVTVVLADPLSFPMQEVAARISDQRPGQPLIGGLVTGGPGRSRFVLDGHLHEDGAVGVVLRDVAVDAVVSPGCRSIGDPLTVTEVADERIVALAGQPALERLEAALTAIDREDGELLRRGGLHLGIVVDEVQDAYDPADLLVRPVLDVDAEEGSVTVGEHVEVGTIVQFQVRDARTADHDLRQRLAGLSSVAGSLLFSCTGRGSRLFDTPDHDVAVVEDILGGAVAGAFCAGEIGPIGRRSYLHGFSASLAVFRQDGTHDRQPE